MQKIILIYKFTPKTAVRYKISSSVPQNFPTNLCIVSTIIIWNDINLTREYSALPAVVNMFPVWSSQNKWTRLPLFYNQNYTPQFLPTMNTFTEHIYCSVLFEISITLFKILRAFRIKQNVHKSVWKLDGFERSDVAKTDWWVLVVTDIAECIETFKLWFWSHNKLQFLHSCLHSQNNLLFTLTVRRFW